MLVNVSGSCLDDENLDIKSVSSFSVRPRELGVHEPLHIQLIFSNFLFAVHFAIAVC